MADLLKTSNFLPSGLMAPFAGSTAPVGWLLCDGSAVSRTDYANLFAIIGTTYGTGDGSTTFNIPDTRAAFLRGAGTSTGFTQNHTTTLGTKESDSMQGHNHGISAGQGSHAHTIYGINYGMSLGGSTFSMMYDSSNNGNKSSAGATLPAMTADSVATKGSYGTPRESNETRPNNLGVNFIIKT